MQNDPRAEAPASSPTHVEPSPPPVPATTVATTALAATAAKAARVREIGGPPGPEPTRYGDWEKQGRCIDF